MQSGKAVSDRSGGWRAKLAYAQYPIFALIWAHASRVTIRLTSSSAGAICPAGSLRWEPYTPLAQCVTVLVDAMLVTQVAESRRHISNAWYRTAHILLASAGVLTFLAMFSFYHPRNIRWALMLDYVAVRDLLVDGSTACVTLLTGIYLLSFINTVLTPVILLSLDPRAATVTGLPASDVRLVRFLARSYVVLMGVLFGAFLVCSPDVVLGGAISIQDLISAANVRSDHWVAQANRSTSLVEAVEEYRRRYQVSPPPNFDKWYEYATIQESVVIDDFGQISTDLKPFWGRSPAALREQTRHMLSYTPWLSMAGIKIRNGTVKIMPGVPGSHAWMMSAMREMIEPFAQHLPDLDFVMNLNDEPRVAVPYEVMNKLQADSRLARSELALREELRPFDASRTPTWPEVELRDNMDPSPYFTNELRNQIYYTRGSWQTSLRARLVHAASHLPPLTASNPGYDHELPRVDIGFVDEFQKCHQDDCRSEETAFWGAGAEKPPLERVPFEQHWQYRHLMDLDGAGFSGRFLPFLRSRSLVYRTGLFRTWFGERVHAWRHYVPVDVRLHELWDLLRFFGGDRGGAGLGQNIAMEGRAWAAQALRKQDMQVYMFRLLLEWARLVDDQRDSLGYVT
ncbi:hypothetical protein ACHAQF_007089 [Verticillium nonalfalfae]